MQAPSITRKDITAFLWLSGAWGIVCGVLEAVLMVAAAYFLIYGILIVGLISIDVAAPLFETMLPSVRLPSETEAIAHAVLGALDGISYVPTFILYFGSGALAFVYLFLLRGAVGGNPMWLVVAIVLLAATVMLAPLGPGLAALVEYGQGLRAMRAAGLGSPQAMQARLGFSAFHPPGIAALAGATLLIPTVIGALGVLVALLRIPGAALGLFFPIVRQGMRFWLPAGAARGRYNWRRLAPAGRMLSRIAVNLLSITALAPISVAYWLLLLAALSFIPAFDDISPGASYLLVWIASIVFFLPIWIYIYFHERRRIGSVRMALQFLLVNAALIVVLALLYEYVYGRSLVSAVFAALAIFLGYAARLTFFSSLLEAADEWRHAARASAAQLIEVSRRPPILFLRTFDEDDLFVRASNLFDRIVFAHRRRHVRLEEVVAEQAFFDGPVIALSNPKLGLQPLGAARENVSDDHWRDYVAKSIRESQAVILCLGKTENVRWEIEKILSLDGAEKLIVVLPTSYPADRTISDVNPLLAERLRIPDAAFEQARLRRARVIYFDRRRGGPLAIQSLQRSERAFATAMQSALSDLRRASRAEGGAEAVQGPASTPTAGD